MLLRTIYSWTPESLNIGLLVCHIVRKTWKVLMEREESFVLLRPKVLKILGM